MNPLTKRFKKAGIITFSICAMFVSVVVATATFVKAINDKPKTVITTLEEKHLNTTTLLTTGLLLSTTNETILEEEVTDNNTPITCTSVKKGTNEKIELLKDNNLLPQNDTESDQWCVVALKLANNTPGSITFALLINGKQYLDTDFYQLSGSERKNEFTAEIAFKSPKGETSTLVVMTPTGQYSFDIN